MKFDDVLKIYRDDSYNTAGLGAHFEELIARYLKTDPMYSPQLESVWVWNSFPFRKEISDHDTGIDLVVKTKTGEYWAIQCKFYEENHRVSKDDLDTFISTSGKRFKDDSGEFQTFSQRIIFATTNNWTETAVTSTENQTIPVVRVGLNKLREAPVDWKSIYGGVHGISARKEKYSLRPHQQEAFDKAIEHFRKNDRGQMIMACGTGKTFTSLRIAEKLSVDGNRCVLFLAPSIALVGQTLREWTANAENDLNIIAVCSDPKVTKRKSNDDLGERVEDLGAPATTDPKKILELYEVGGKDRLTVVFSTYQSIDAVIEAQKAGFPVFDLIVCDEAHRTTGAIFNKAEEKYFTKVHDNSIIAGKKRLYMTATPRIYGAKGKDTAEEKSVTLCSMDDPETYGTEFYKIGFGEAVEKDLLSDYKVLILTIEKSEIEGVIKRRLENSKYGPNVDTETAGKVWGCMNALAKNIAYDETVKNTDPGRMKSAVAFTRTIASSKDLADIFNMLSEDPAAPIYLEMDHIDGSMDAFKRDTLLTWLKEGDSEECRVLSNVRCLSEGVDVPALDAVMFLSNKNSLIDIVQSVGRVMRKAPGKKYGYIIIPVIAPEGTSAEAALDNDERYKVVWQVLRALRSHDERLEAEVNTIAYSNKTDGRILPARLKTGRPDTSSDAVGGKARQYLLSEFETALLARLVLKVGDRDYIENWAKDVAVIMPDLIERLTKICNHEEHGYKQFRPAFTRYLKGLRANINGNVSEDDAINMLAQQIITKPIFMELFGNETFVQKNTVSSTINEMLDEIGEKDALKGIELETFYNNVKNTLSRIDKREGKQKVITALYEKFFKNAFPKDQAISGVVYTPIEVVDFILRSAADILKEEFGIDINDENVNILDPFTGTGTFIARLMETGIITKENLEHKYKNELFANEITLLAYYIAAVNIENTFSRIMNSESYVPFENIVLTDTFNIEEICRKGSVYNQTDLTGKEYFKGNKDKIKKEHNTPITLIIGNPPYGANQKSANDDAKKRKYESGVDKAIREMYLDDSLFSEKKGLVNSVYDNYVRAFRWSTDRIGDNDGIIAFVTPSGWMMGSAFEGFRKTVEKEFSKIYIFDLRGDQNSGNWRKEGEKIFGEGSKIGIAITLLVRRRGYKGKANIQYFKTPDYAKRVDKLNLLTSSKSFVKLDKEKKLEKIEPKPNGDWLIERNEVFDTLTPLAGDTNKKFDKHNEKTIFVGYSRGYGSSSDAWSYNYSKEEVLRNMQRLLEEYNDQVSNGEQIFDPLKISWFTKLKNLYKSGKKVDFKPEKLRSAPYRPFCKRFLYSDDEITDGGVFQITKFFPQNDSKNLQICVAGIGVKKDFSCMITNRVTDLEIVGKSQCFPLYWYEDTSDIRAKNKQKSLFDDAPSLIRHDGVSDYALKTAKSKYSLDVTKEDIFYYVYGYLHSPEYREAFLEDLKLSLPKIGFVDTLEDFRKFVKAGRDLADLHLNYENLEPPSTVKLSGDQKIEDVLKNSDLCLVKKMKLIPEKRKLVYNQYITMENIPEDAFEYIVNGRSALGWLVDQYQYTVDKSSGIINDPNEYAGSAYILKLVLSVISVSVKTMEIVKSLPKLDFEEK